MRYLSPAPVAVPGVETGGPMGSASATTKRSAAGPPATRPPLRAGPPHRGPGGARPCTRVGHRGIARDCAPRPERPEGPPSRRAEPWPAAAPARPRRVPTAAAPRSVVGKAVVEVWRNGRAPHAGHWPSGRQRRLARDGPPVRPDLKRQGYAPYGAGSPVRQVGGGKGPLPRKTIPSVVASAPAAPQAVTVQPRRALAERGTALSAPPPVIATLVDRQGDNHHPVVHTVRPTRLAPWSALDMPRAAARATPDRATGRPPRTPESPLDQHGCPPPTRVAEPARLGVPPRPAPRRPVKPPYGPWHSQPNTAIRLGSRCPRRWDAVVCEHHRGW